MNWIDRIRGRVQPRAEPEAKPAAVMAVGAKDDASTMTYNDKTITYSGDLASYDYDAILRDKQRSINSLYKLADYYVDADPIFRGIINGVYVPFSLSDDFRLVGASEQTKAKYLEYYDRIHLKDRFPSRNPFRPAYSYSAYTPVRRWLLLSSAAAVCPSRSSAAARSRSAAYSTPAACRWPAEARARTDRPHPAEAERCAEAWII